MKNHGYAIVMEKTSSEWSAMFPISMAALQRARLKKKHAGSFMRP